MKLSPTMLEWIDNAARWGWQGEARKVPLRTRAALLERGLITYNADYRKFANAKPEGTMHPVLTPAGWAASKWDRPDDEGRYGISRARMEAYADEGRYTLDEALNEARLKFGDAAVRGEAGFEGTAHVYLKITPEVIEALTWLRTGWDGSNSEKAINSFNALDNAGVFAPIDEETRCPAPPVVTA